MAEVKSTVQRKDLQHHFRARARRFSEEGASTGGGHFCLCCEESELRTAVDLAVLHDEAHPAQGGDVGQGVPLDRDDRRGNCGCIGIIRSFDRDI